MSRLSATVGPPFKEACIKIATVHADGSWGGFAGRQIMKSPGDRRITLQGAKAADNVGWEPPQPTLSLHEVVSVWRCGCQKVDLPESTHSDRRCDRRAPSFSVSVSGA
jgi:hypothetical protein